MKLLPIIGFAVVVSSRAWGESPSTELSKKPQPASQTPVALEPSRKVQRVLLQKMKSVKPEVRQAAVGELRQYPTAEAARFLAQHGLASDYDDVRHAAYHTLLDLNEAGPVAGFLLDKAAKEFKRSAPSEIDCAMLMIAMASEDADIERRALELFDQVSRQIEAGAEVVLALVDELGAQGEESSVATLMKIAKRPVFDDRFAVRRAVVQALARMPQSSAIEALVTIMATATGEIRGDIVRRLTAVSGQRFGLDPQAWAAWWNARQGKLPQGGSQYVSLSDAIPSKSTYYGLPIYAARLVFVLDTSASMAGGRIFAAKRELTSAIASLPEGAYFDVLAFDMIVSPWSPQLLPASADNKAAAIGWVLSRGLGPQTASYNALQAAFAFDTESIYFLTDGQPAGGVIDNPAQIVAVLTQLNRTRRLTINTIGVGVGPAGPANPFDLFLASLAGLNFGEYRRVNQ